MSRKVTVARHAGFCYGVRRATDMLEEVLRSKKPGETIYTLGHLIHNEVYLKSLEERGVASVGEDEILRLSGEADPEHPVTLLLRAHGIPFETLDVLAEKSRNNPSFRYLDCTCPFVEKIRKIARELDVDNDYLVVIGDENHPEVRGILSCFKGEKYVFSGPEALKDAAEHGIVVNMHKKHGSFVAQTTYSITGWAEITNICEKLFTNYTIFDTICYATGGRQLEAQTLAKSCDLMIVIGGKDSSNTDKLYRLCKKDCANTLRIGSAAELSAVNPASYQRIGIVAGASTPSSCIEEVYQTMSEISNENFGELLDSESSCKTVRQGEIVKGTITYVSDKELQVDLGTSVTGIIKADNIFDDPSAKLTEQFKVGDEVEAKVIRVSDIEGIAELSKRQADAGKNWKVIVDAKESKENLTGKVIEVVNAGVIVLVNSIRVFVPASQSGLPKDGDLNTLNGQTVELKIIDIKEGSPRTRRAVGSIRLAAREAARAERKAREAEFWANLQVGQEFQGKVRNLTNYGAFVDIGGHDGMVHVTELSWRRIGKPADVCKEGDVLTVYVREFDPAKKRISLTCKSIGYDPWEAFQSQYEIGSVASVKIVSLVAFGAFAEILPGVDGLIHISQIADHKISKADEVLEVGQTVDAKITDIDYEKHKVSLSIRALIEEAMAASEEDAEETAPEAEEAPEAPVEETVAEEAAPEEETQA